MLAYKRKGNKISEQKFGYTFREGSENIAYINLRHLVCIPAGMPESNSKIKRFLYRCGNCAMSEERI